MVLLEIGSELEATKLKLFAMPNTGEQEFSIPPIKHFYRMADSAAQCTVLLERPAVTQLV
jgi:hypothetical protein